MSESSLNRFCNNSSTRSISLFAIVAALLLPVQRWAVAFHNRTSILNLHANCAMEFTFPRTDIPAHERRKAVLVLYAALDVEQHFHFCFHALLFLIAILLILRQSNDMRIRQNGAIKTGRAESAG